MILAIDVGNSEITIGLQHLGRWIQHWRITSQADQPNLFYTIKIRDYFLEAQIKMGDVDRIVLSSVVPTLTKKMHSVVTGLFSRDIIMVGPETYKYLPIQILNPQEIGSDLVCNAVAAFTKYSRVCIVVDFGTALTFTTVSDAGQIRGVSIAPGLQTAITSLSQNTAKLFEVPLEMPASALGTSTVTAIQTGIMLGYEGLVKNIVSAIQREIGEKCFTIATGGLSSAIASLESFFDVTESSLTLDGLIIIADFVEAGQGP